MTIAGFSMGTAVFVMWTTNTIISFVFPLLVGALGATLTFGLFTIVSACSFWFVWRSCPETRGRTLEELEDDFRPHDAAHLLHTPPDAVPGSSGERNVPLVPIEVEQGRSAMELRHLADVVHEVMHDVFAAPSGDKHRVLTEHPAGQVIAGDSALDFVAPMTSSSRSSTKAGPSSRRPPPTRLACAWRSSAAFLPTT